jgi:hypothetical protein
MMTMVMTTSLRQRGYAKYMSNQASFATFVVASAESNPA